MKQGFTSFHHGRSGEVIQVPQALAVHAGARVLTRAYALVLAQAYAPALALAFPPACARVLGWVAVAGQCHRAWRENRVQEGAAWAVRASEARA